MQSEVRIVIRSRCSAKNSTTGTSSRRWCRPA